MVDLQRIREAAKLTQEQLAQKVDVKRTTISNIECGIAKPSVDLAKKLGKILNFNWTDFYNE